MVRHRQSSSGGHRTHAATAAAAHTAPGGAAAQPRTSGTIRGRLARILALPVVAVLVLLGVVVSGDVAAYRTARATTGEVALALGVQSLVQELQQERGLTSGLLGGNVGFKPEIDPARRNVDDVRGALAQLASGTNQGAGAVRTELGQLDSSLTASRAQIDAGKATRAGSFQYLTGHIAALNAVDFGLANSADLTLRRGVAALTALAQTKEYLAQERAFLNGVFSAGGFGKGEYTQFAGMYAAAHQAETQFGQVATLAQIDRAKAVQGTGAYSEAMDFETRALNAADGRLLQVDPQSWWSALTTVLDGIRSLEQSLGADIQHQATILRTNASRRLAVLGGLVLFCLLCAGALVIAAARSITRPLAVLAFEAEAVASRRLPDAVSLVQSGSEEEQPDPPVPVAVPRRASSEIHSVAAALNRVQATAYALATEQALLRRNTTESLANLGRRNQSLLRRQLGFISRLESEESDPSGLANLFELDHLATRMRRNAESLLVLVGEDSPRAWASAMPVADVIRAAISEVEEYRRVTLRRIDDGFIAGAFVTGIAHMVAELVENGLTFSPPDVDVEIQGRNLGDQYLIAITDQGIGMATEELDKANARLRGAEHFLMAPARFLGHYVVGQLGRQMSVDVQLSPSPVTGITARVMLPSRVLAAASSIPSGEYAAIRTERPRIVPASIVDEVRSVPKPPAPVSAQLAIGVRAEPPGARPNNASAGSGVSAAEPPGTRPNNASAGSGVSAAEPPGTRPNNASAGSGVSAAEPPGPRPNNASAGSGVSAAEPPGARPNNASAGSGVSAAEPPGARPNNASAGSGVSAAVPVVEYITVPGTAPPADTSGRSASNAPGGTTPGGSAPAGSAAVGTADRTRNGLRKRPPRVRAAQAAPGPPGAPGAPGMDDSPAQVRDRMTSLRDGFQRNEREREKTNDER
jgi:signal transduction histidine kinase